MTFLTNPAHVTRVWVTFNFNDVVPEFDADSTDELPADFDARVSAAYVKMESLTREKFPNATDVMVHCAGWDGDNAQIGPRADDSDNAYYDGFFDWLESACQSLG